MNVVRTDTHNEPVHSDTPTPLLTSDCVLRVPQTDAHSGLYLAHEEHFTRTIVGSKSLRPPVKVLLLLFLEYHVFTILNIHILVLSID